MEIRGGSCEFEFGRTNIRNLIGMIFADCAGLNETAVDSTGRGNQQKSWKPLLTRHLTDELLGATVTTSIVIEYFIIQINY